MARWVALVLLGLALVVAPAGAGGLASGAALAAESIRPSAARGAVSDGDSDLLIRIHGPVRIGPGEHATAAVVIGDDAVVEGAVKTLVVMGGRARVSGVVLRDVVVVDGALDLGPGARIGHDVTLVRSELTQGPGSLIGGIVHRTIGPAWSWGVSWFFWLATTVFMIAAGLLFAALGGRQLAGAAGMLANQPGGSILTGFVLWIVLPLVAVVALVTVVGIPLGVGVFLFVLPALWLLGYLVAGAALGGLLVQGRRALAYAEHPYAAVVLGLLLLQLAGHIPWVGAFVLALAGLAGAGALALRSWRMARGQRGGPWIPTPAPGSPPFQAHRSDRAGA